MLTESGHLEGFFGRKIVEELSADLFQGGEAALEVGCDRILEVSPEVLHRIGLGRALEQEHSLQALVKTDHLFHGLRGVPPGPVSH